MGVQKRAFTLTELLVVVAIVGLLIVGIAGIGNYVKTQAKIALTKQCIQLLATATAEFYDITGHYPVDSWNERDAIGSRIEGAMVSGGALPRSIDLLYLQLNLLSQTQQIVTKLPGNMVVLPPANSATVHLAGQLDPANYLRPVEDPWGNLLGYNTANGVSHIWSCGPDGISGNEDDISN